MATLKVAIDAREATRGAAVADKAFKQVQTGAGKTASSLKPAKLGFDGLRQSMFLLTRVAAPLAAAFSVGFIVSQVNAYQQLQNRLRLVTSSQVELIAVQDRLFKVAQNNRSSLEGVADLYSRIARSSKQLGLSQEDVIETTDAVSKAIVVSGASAQNATAALVQLGQALASDRLSGDELRSILENAPRLAQSIADGMGVTIGELRKLGAEGKLTSDKVVAAIRSQAKVLSEEFGKTIPTVDQSFTTLKNSTLQFVGQLDEATGFSRGLSSALSGLSKFLDENAGAFADAAFEASQFIRIASGAIKLKLFDSRNSDLIDNSIVGTLATLFGDEKVIEEAAQGRLRLQASLDKDFQALADSVDKERAAYEERKRLRNEAAKLDLDKPPDTPAGRGPSQEELDAAAKALKELEDFAASVAESVMTPTEVFEAQAAKLDVVLARGLITQRQYSLAILEAAQAMNEANPAQIEYQKILEEGITLTESLRTPYEELMVEIERYQLLLERGAINEETYARAVESSTEKYKTAIDKRAEANTFLEEITKQAARNMQDAFANFLFNPLEEGFDGLLSNFVTVLQRMAAEALSAEVFKILAEQFKLLGQDSGGGFLGAIFTGLSGIFGGGKAEGGAVQPGKTYMVGEEGPELASFDRAGTITPADKTAQMMGAAPAPQVSVPVQVVNVSDPNEIPSAMQGSAGQQAIINVLTRNKSAVRAILNGA